MPRATAISEPGLMEMNSSALVAVRFWRLAKAMKRWPSGLPPRASAMPRAAPTGSGPVSRNSEPNESTTCAFEKSRLGMPSLPKAMRVASRSGAKSKAS